MDPVPRRKSDPKLAAIVARNFKHFREEAGLEQAEAARRLEISNSALWRIEKGESGPSQKTKVDAAHLYGRMPHEFEMETPPPRSREVPQPDVFQLKVLTDSGLTEEEIEEIARDLRNRLARANLAAQEKKRRKIELEGKEKGGGKEKEKPKKGD